MNHLCKALYVAALMLPALSACGGGGSGVASTPTPPPAPPAPPASPSSAVDIFPSPVTQEFAVAGVGADLKIRYDAATNKYEVKAGSFDWTRLVDDPLSAPLAGNPNTNFVFEGAPTNTSFLMIRAHYSYSDPAVKYQYSNLAAWANAGVGGIAAFGIATPSTGVPITGSATYNGFLEGTSTDTYNYGEGIAAGTMSGKISLAFDFASGSLSGQVSPVLGLDKTYPLSTLTFTNTVHSRGSNAFSGQFSTALAGPNSFSGLFTGPNAQELIGKYAFPYLSPVTGTTQQSIGAFIAKR